MRLVRFLAAGVAIFCLVALAACAVGAGLVTDGQVPVGSGSPMAIPVPEPATLAFLGIGSLGLLAMRRRRVRA